MSEQLIELSGWIGQISFAICVIPQALDSWKNKHSGGINGWFLLLWVMGEVFSLIYILPKGLTPIILNYIINLLFLVVIVWFKLFPDERKVVK